MVVLLIVDVEGVVAPCEGEELFVVSERRLKCLNGIVISFLSLSFILHLVKMFVCSSGTVKECGYSRMAGCSSCPTSCYTLLILQIHEINVVVFNPKTSEVAST